jgi:DNA-binding MarR family transcriptional regulator
VTLPESSALAQLERQGPLASGALAQLEQISAQSMGTTLSALQARGLVQRAADPGDGRRVVVSLTAEGREAMLGLRRERAEWLADALANGFTPLERAQLSAAIPLLDRLARTN